ncbi:MAG: hypothetical protein ABIQ11_02970 [Saprospiraceae bacterium]
MLGSIATYFFEKEKQKRVGAGKRAKVEFFAERKNHYGLLVDASNPDDRATILVFAEQLRREGNRVKILGYVDGKQEKISISFDVFTSAELTRFSKVPKSPVAESFMDLTFDVLINLSIKQNHKALEYICAVSKSAFRVGPWYAGQQNNPYDLCVDAGSTTSLKEWLNELMHTLRKIH